MADFNVVEVDANPLSLIGQKLVFAVHHAAAIAATTYVMLIDLSDAGGDYKHAGTSSIKLASISASLVKSTIGAQWKSVIGVILAVNATDATILWLDGAALFSLDTSALERHKATALPWPADLLVTAGDLADVAGGFAESGITEVNTTGTLNNVEGNAKTPAVGDLVLRIEQISGGGTAEVHYSARYYVD